jgi:hypothetical protein
MARLISVSVIPPTPPDDIDLHLVVAQVQQRRLQRLEGAAHVGLDHDVERLLLARGHALEHVVELAAC